MSSSLLFLLSLCLSLSHSILLYQDFSLVSFGHTKECFQFAILSFESCRQLFVRSKCSVMRYENKICSLHDHTAHDFQIQQQREERDKEREENEHEKSIILWKSNVSLSTHSAPFSSLSATTKYRKCMKSQVDEIENFSSLPRLGIVISVTSEWVTSHQAGVMSLTSNFECYAKAHNYSFVSVFLVSNNFP